MASFVKCSETEGSRACRLAEEYRGKYGTMWLPARRRRQLRNQTREDAAERLEPLWEMEGVQDEMEDRHVEIHQATPEKTLG